MVLHELKLHEKLQTPSDGMMTPRSPVCLYMHGVTIPAGHCVVLIFLFNFSTSHFRLYLSMMVAPDGVCQSAVRPPAGFVNLVVTVGDCL